VRVFAWRFFSNDIFSKRKTQKGKREKGTKKRKNKLLFFRASFYHTILSIKNFKKSLTDVKVTFNIRYKKLNRHVFDWLLIKHHMIWGVSEGFVTIERFRQYRKVSAISSQFRPIEKFRILGLKRRNVSTLKF